MHYIKEPDRYKHFTMQQYAKMKMKNLDLNFLANTLSFAGILRSQEFGDTER